MQWLHTLPPPLQDEVAALISAVPQAAPTLDKLFEYASNSPQKQKIPDPPRKKRQQTSAPPQLPPPLTQADIIFHLSNISCQSPFRKRLGFAFHLALGPQGPVPALSLVNNQLQPEFSLMNLGQDIVFCSLLPILGNSTVSSKKDTVLLLVWLAHGDPIVCQLNFDAVKKQLVAEGKVPASAESELDSESEEDDAEGIRPINEALVDFLVRQFQLCGIRLLNYLPFSTGSKNKLTLNKDTALALSTNGTSVNDVVIVQAYRGSKDGALVLLGGTQDQPGTIIFGFRKPILLFRANSVKRISYSNITRLTFNVSVTVHNDTRPDGEETIEFSMLDQAYFQILDDFVKRQGINDDSFNEALREKQKADPNVKAETDAEDAEAPDSDDEEEDGTYQAGVESDSDNEKKEEDGEENSEDEDSEDGEESEDSEDGELSEDGESDDLSLS
ncbi:hypothetical protein PGUG_01650 [Meyerozyma guilliermondii ATCC 6260]|uniref:Histone chaperone RTT106 n=1 Tax=Meyerozyma guilliermondii (strain ATCC 6260 / CBS 566 / DSM 6381 / JCM 1539 / NBRC 10279 / NRRL Y-324) TaxID=294746 RepID=RT106_PICGU|nr:uncharacterized protein PGUG_01650 [Meyerozyma guilliermondii ATCC 6260]A5DEE9.2 RecName: Full=Histone chaperone RTT106 [Meyerozyma guilliermondii ATCC 6260]EDK37552.2 hypothetical protein PGUG_01650 [Meyerozyma guilliermondii ATCC 6260]